MITLKLKNKLNNFLFKLFLHFANISLLVMLTLLLSFCNPNTTNGGSDNDRELERRQAIINSLNMSNTNLQTLLDNLNMSNINLQTLLDNLNMSNTNLQSLLGNLNMSYNDLNNTNNFLQKVINSIDSSFVTKFGANGTAEGQFINPSSIAIDDNYIYVADYGSGRKDVQVFYKGNRSFFTRFGNGSLSNPFDIAVDDAFVYVMDSGLSSIQVFYKGNHSFFTQIGRPSADVDNIMHGEFFSSAGFIAVDNDSIYATDETRDDVQIFNKGNYSDIVSIGTDTGNNFRFFFNNTRDVEVDDSYIYVLDSIRESLDIFNKSSKMHVDSIPIRYTSVFTMSIGNDYIYIPNSTNNEVEIFYKGNRSFFTKFGGTGMANGQFMNPLGGISIDDNYIYVADLERDEIQVFNKLLSLLIR